MVLRRVHRQQPAVNVTPSNEMAATKVKVVTTLFPWYDMARAIGGDRAEVSLLLPPGVEAHSFEPTPSDFALIDASDAFVYTGKSLEQWAADIAQNSAPQTIVLDASDGIELLPNVVKDPDEPDQTMDPHFWLNTDNLAMVADRMEQILEEKDPAGTELFRTRLAAYRDALKALDERYRRSLSTCQVKTMVYGGHYAFGYVAKRYGLQYKAAQGLSPDAEPSAKDLAALVEQIRRERIRTIFSEALESSKVADTLAQETMAQTLSLYPAENVS